MVYQPVKIDNRKTESFRKKMSNIAIKNGFGKMGNRKGKKHSEESKQKMREASLRLGLRPPCGINSPMYKGGISSTNELIRKSAIYRIWRKSVFERDNYTCLHCGIVGGKLHADHIKPFSLFPELRFAIDNGRTLCIPCHLLTDTYGGKNNKKNGKL